MDSIVEEWEQWEARGWRHLVQSSVLLTAAEHKKVHDHGIYVAFRLAMPSIPMAVAFSTEREPQYLMKRTPSEIVDTHFLSQNTGEREEMKESVKKEVEWEYNEEGKMEKEEQIKYKEKEEEDEREEDKEKQG